MGGGCGGGAGMGGHGSGAGFGGSFDMTKLCYFCNHIFCVDISCDFYESCFGGQDCGMIVFVKTLYLLLLT